MSSEEEGTFDTGTTVIAAYFVKLCGWRALAMTDYMELIDNSTPKVKTSRGGANVTRLRGIDPVSVSTSNPPAGLPRKMYDEAWLAQKEKEQPIWVLKTLRVSKEVFELLVLATDKGKGRQMDDDDV